MTIHATITYALSEGGRRVLLRSGGDGKRLQTQSGTINDEDLESFRVDSDGQVSFDATSVCWDGESGDYPAEIGNLKLIDEHGREWTIEWKTPPNWLSLVSLVRWAANAEQTSLSLEFDHHMEDEARRKKIADCFLNDPSALADQVTDKVVRIGDDEFNATEPVSIEARRRNREAFGDWIRRYGTENQIQRFEAGHLPWSEGVSLIESQLFGALDEFHVYERFVEDDVCLCKENQECRVRFQSVDAGPLSASEWELYQSILSAFPEASFQPREHRAFAGCRPEPLVRRGVIVKKKVGSLLLKREYALTVPTSGVIQ